MALSVSDTQAKQRFALTVSIRPVIYTDKIHRCDIPKFFINKLILVFYITPKIFPEVISVRVLNKATWCFKW